MKKIILSIAMLLMGMLWAPTVSAHTLKIDGTMGVTLHIDPDDQPVVGVESKLFVEIEDKSGRFDSNNPSNCFCILRVVSRGETIATLPVVSGGSYAQLRYTFAAPGRYRVIVEGKPNKDGQLFQAFSTTFEYYVRGDADISERNPLLAYVPYVVALDGVIIILMFAGIKSGKRS